MCLTTVLRLMYTEVAVVTSGLSAPPAAPVSAHNVSAASTADVAVVKKVKKRFGLASQADVAQPVPALPPQQGGCVCG